MKITRQPHLAALAANGIAPIHLPLTWESNRLRLGTGVVVHSEAPARP